MEATKRKLEEENNGEHGSNKVCKVSSSTPINSSNPAIDKNILRIYYDRLFPVGLFFKWLSYADNNELIKKREFSFTLEGDVYIRYCSFTTKEEFKAGLLSKVPIKIDIGACFNAPPNQHESVANFKPQSKEFVIDIDMTDYDEVRSCCSGADICERCWVLMTAALKVVDRMITQDFGFKRRLWVYSGRRGIHCWVCDKEARAMTDRARSAVISYMSIELQKRELCSRMDVGTNTMHPTLNQAYDEVLPYFEGSPQLDDRGIKSIIDSQHLMETEESTELMLSIMGLENDEDFTPVTTMDNKTGLQKWEWLKKKVNSKNKARGAVKNALQMAVFTYCYPRLDANVSKQLNHLLKSPFCVHPKTGRVCVPIDPSLAEEFDPSSVPTLNQLHDELNAQPLSKDKNVKSWQGTSLQPHIEHFEKFVKVLQEDYRAEARADNKAKTTLRMEGVTYDDESLTF